ncbi:MAG: tandem-95 repeat protein [Caldilineaceae bacterium]|nr:tandem-95 repeat protein [Caldilineaceae bacterium]
MALPDHAATDLATPISLAVVLNDEDDNEDALKLSSVGPAASGLVTLETDVSVRYTPTVGVTASDIFTYEVTDGSATAVGVVTVEVADINVAPVAVGDIITITEDSAATLDVLENDSDINDDDLLEIVQVGVAGSGVLALQGPSLVYSPGLDFHGTDWFTYTVSDGELTATAPVTLTIVGVNDAPVAVDDLAEAVSGEAITISVLLNDWDVDSSGLVVAGVSSPTNGVAGHNAATIWYRSTPEFVGNDWLEYTVSDGSATATGGVTVVVSSGPIDPPPTDIITEPVGIDNGAGEGLDITGVIFQDVNRNGTLDVGDLPLADVQVTLSRDSIVPLEQGSVMPLWRTSTDRDGVYHFEDVPLGEYRMVIAPPVGYKFTGPLERRVSVGGEDQAHGPFDVGIVLHSIYIPFVAYE